MTHDVRSVAVLARPEMEQRPAGDVAVPGYLRIRRRRCGTTEPWMQEVP